MHAEHTTAAEPVPTQGLAFLRVETDAHAPRLQSGDQILLRPADRFHGSGFYVVERGGQLMIVQAEMCGSETLRLMDGRRPFEISTAWFARIVRGRALGVHRSLVGECAQ